MSFFILDGGFLCDAIRFLWLSQDRRACITPWLAPRGGLSTKYMMGEFEW